MKAFSTLFDRLTVTPKPENQIAILRDYLAQTPDPERGFALAALAGTLNLRATRPALIRALMEPRSDAKLFDMSLDYVGDLAETVSLLWPAAQTNHAAPSLSEIVAAVRETPKAEMPEMIARWLDACEPAGRWALLKLLTGGLSVGMPSRRLKAAVAALSDRLAVDDIEAVWHGLEPPYAALFNWVENSGPRPDTEGFPNFHPVMLGTTVETPESLDGQGFVAEYKWTGARVQWVQRDGQTRLYSRAGDDLSRAFPDLLEPLSHDAVLEGQLMVLRNGKPGTAEDLQRRLRRKTINKAVLDELPARLMVFDLLAHHGEDLRAMSLEARRARLGRLALPASMQQSPALPTEDLSALHQSLHAVEGAEGLVLKRASRPYQAGRSPDDWLKWQRAAHRFRAVLLYIQRAQGGPRARFTEFTFGAVTQDDSGGTSLIPIGKAAPTLTEDELAQINAYVLENTIERFGPVRSIKAGLVLEIAFDAIESSKRRKSGLALRAPRVVKLLPDTRWEQADTHQSLLKMIP